MKYETKDSTYLRLLEGRENIIIIDTETTGADPATDELLQVSIINGAGDILFDRHIRPTKATCWPEAEQINHISPDKVQSEPTIEDLLPDIQRIVSKADCIIGYNVVFDIDFLRWANCAFPDWSGDTPSCLIIDVMELFAAIYGSWNPYYQNYRWQKLATAADYYHYRWDNAPAHNALGDCYATLHIWRRMVEAGDVQKAEELIQAAMAQGYPDGYYE